MYLYQFLWLFFSLCFWVLAFWLCENEPSHRSESLTHRTTTQAMIMVSTFAFWWFLGWTWVAVYLLEERAARRGGSL